MPRPTASEQRKAEQLVEYGTYRAIVDIRVGTALAYKAGEPVPVSNVEAHGYLEKGQVCRVDGPAVPRAVEVPAHPEQSDHPDHP